MMVSGISENSKRVQPGDLFIARVGTRSDGRRFIGDAVAAGASAVLTDASVTVPDGPAVLRCESIGDVPAVAATIAERLNGRPSEQLTLIGVTGTNGKSTVAHMTRELLAATGRRCGLIGTIEIDDTVESTPSELTTPPAHDLSAILRRMVDRGCDACVMEVSSHALTQDRVSALAFDVGVFTNLSGDHLDYHESMSVYAATKARLFAILPPSGLAVVNVDDPASSIMTVGCRAEVANCSLKGHGDWNSRVLGKHLGGLDLELRDDRGHAEIRLPLLGEHNAMNALQAAAVARYCGAESRDISAALERCTSPAGRLETVTPPGHPFTVLVDYAHTDDALDKALAAVRPIVPDGGRLHVVFGCGGDRDCDKRPRMARAVMRWADQATITSDNPRNEPPARIIEQVVAGVPKERLKDVMCEENRRQAIAAAVANAEVGDVLVIAGKGHEPYQLISGRTVAFDDRQVAREAIDVHRWQAESA